MTKITNFVWNSVDDCIISEIDGTGAVQAVYTNEPQQYGDVISQRRGTTTSTHHYDALGSTRFLTDSSGNVTNTYLNDAWGNLVASTGTTVNPFKWVGKYSYYTDDSTGQVYVRARMYEPTLATWTSRDALQFVRSTNGYDYSTNAPVLLIDATGLFCFDLRSTCQSCWDKALGGGLTEPQTIVPGADPVIRRLIGIMTRPGRGVNSSKRVWKRNCKPNMICCQGDAGDDKLCRPCDRDKGILGA